MFPLWGQTCWLVWSCFILFSFVTYSLVVYNDEPKLLVFLSDLYDFILWLRCLATAITVVQFMIAHMLHSRIKSEIFQPCFFIHISSRFIYLFISHLLFYIFILCILCVLFFELFVFIFVRYVLSERSDVVSVGGYICNVVIISLFSPMLLIIIRYSG